MNINQRMNEYGDLIETTIDTSHMTQQPADKMANWKNDLDVSKTQMKLDRFEEDIKEAHQQLERKTSEEMIKDHPAMHPLKSETENISDWKKENMPEIATKKLDEFEDRVREAREKLTERQQMRIQDINAKKEAERQIANEYEISGEEVIENIKHEFSELKDAAFTRIEEAVEFVSKNTKLITEDLKHKIGQILNPTN